MISKNVLLIFKSNIMYKPVIYRLAKDFDLVFNILEAKILPRKEGRLLLELRGEEELVEQGHHVSPGTPGRSRVSQGQDQQRRRSVRALRRVYRIMPHRSLAS